MPKLLNAFENRQSKDPRLVILTGAMVEQEHNNYQKAISFLCRVSPLHRLLNIRTYPATIYDDLRWAFPDSQLIVLPNFGLEAPEEVYRHVVDQVKPSINNPVSVIGHSYGGILGPRLAVDYPEAVTTAVSVDSPFEGRVSKYPWDSPLFRELIARTHKLHIDAIRDGYDPDSNQQFANLASEDSRTILPEDALHLNFEGEREQGQNVRRLLFGAPGFNNRTTSSIRKGRTVEHLSSAQPLGHIEMISNPDVIRLCGRILGREVRLQPVARAA